MISGPLLQQFSVMQRMTNGWLTNAKWMNGLAGARLTARAQEGRQKGNRGAGRQYALGIVEQQAHGWATARRRVDGSTRSPRDDGDRPL